MRIILHRSILTEYIFLTNKNNYGLKGSISAPKVKETRNEILDTNK